MLQSAWQRNCRRLSARLLAAFGSVPGSGLAQAAACSLKPHSVGDEPRRLPFPGKKIGQLALTRCQRSNLVLIVCLISAALPFALLPIPRSGTAHAGAGAIMLRWVSALGRRVALRAFTLVHALATSTRLPGPVLRCALTAAALIVQAPILAGYLAVAEAWVLLPLAAAAAGRQARPEQKSQEAFDLLFALQSALGEPCPSLSHRSTERFSARHAVKTPVTLFHCDSGSAHDHLPLTLLVLFIFNHVPFHMMQACCS